MNGTVLRHFEPRDVSVDLLDDNAIYPTQRLEDTSDQPDGDTPVGSLKELEETIRTTRFMRPLTVAQVGARYVMLDGHRRLRVARTLEADTVPCVVLTLEPGETAEGLFVLVQSQEDQPWPWSDIDE